MENKITGLKEHFILCGFGKVGEEITNTFRAEEVPFVIIDNRPGCIARIEQADYLYLEGDATRDEMLKEAGVEQAKDLVAAVGTDTDNTYITLSARGLRPDLFIEARASNEEARTKLKRAGDDRVLLPHNVGGQHMAMLALRPAVVDCIDTVIYSRGREMQLEDVDIGQNSRLVGLTIKATQSETGVTVLVIQKQSDALLPNPPDEEIIEDGDQLIVIGTKQQLAAREEALETGKPSR